MNRKLKARIIEMYESQINFSHAIHVTPERISRIVRQHEQLKPGEMKEWGAALGCDPREIFPDSEGPKQREGT